MIKTFDCNSCGGHHPRLISRNCKADKSEETTTGMDTNAQILQELRILSARMTGMQTKVSTIDGRRSSASETKRHIDDPHSELILPTLYTTRGSRSIQEQVNATVKELKAASDKGKCKSQRGENETGFFVKNEIPWPQNSIFRRISKTRVSYDNLSISHWVLGFASIIKDKKI